KGIKKILKTVSPGSKMPQVSREGIQQFFFLSGFEDKEVDEFSDGSDEASK
ncbi:hypothetical protein HAX54_045731, partial [Datura stramonium]|nr:hypothetical protein [Datura stramonium]